MKELSLGIIGLGNRGSSLLESCVLPAPGVRVAAVCDIYEDRREKAVLAVVEHGDPSPFCTGNYRELLACKELDAVLITTAWEAHIGIACACMEMGLPSAMEVGGAYSLQECWRLVETYERTGVPCMLLENCCYGRDELMVLHMARQGVLGEVVHCGGGYQHDLREEVAYGRENRHYRFENYRRRNCENYPTHELGPIASVLNLNRGNRMVSLVSIASKSAGLHEYLLREKGPGYDGTNMEFCQGDVISTLIRCAGGQTIALTLDTTLPRAYSRGFRVQGTRGMYMEDNKSIFLDKEHNAFDFRWQEQWGNVERYRERWEHPVWKEYLAQGIKGGHDGMDWLVLGAFYQSVREKSLPPIDVYDAAAWMSISCLTEESIAKGGATVAVPDFTCGQWMHREPVVF